MSNEEIKQRIAYLIEHGGIWDDPLADIRRQVRWALGVVIVTLLLVSALHF
jgi:hypothetical protein